MDRGQIGQCYHISGYELISIRELVEAVLKRACRPFDEHVILADTDRPGKDNAYRLDSSKIRMELGWRDKISLDDGIADVIQWTRRFERELADVPLTYEHRP